ncbi:MAG TPA: thymidine phosphorylase [Verrucomicrobiae bacterium]|jgi:pyrimidine-nucleoside phosphorylase|nr:thymidine phosphorylase [Verrucomicrobiae bacterium]
MDDMSMRRAIERKRQGEELEPTEWEAIVSAYVDGTVDDAQMAAMAMACVWRGLSTKESAAMTRAMVDSGQRLEYPTDVVVVDKHSSGGVGDVISMIAVPVVAAAGGHVAKLSGRALGHTGGTIDKLETIPGFDVALSMDAFVRQVERIGCAIATQTDAFVPADKRLYRLRDRTGTVPNMGLIAASIVSKKVAGGAHAFVFDVKCGAAAFMNDPASAIELAQALVAISQEFGKRARAIVSDMNEPLGQSIGTGIEVIEAREFLRGNHNVPRVRTLCLKICETMLDLSGIANPLETATRALDSGAAYEKFVELIEAQRGSRAGFEAMTVSTQHESLLADQSGFVHSMDAVALGNIARDLTARDPVGGIKVGVRTGDRIEKGQPLAEIYGPHGHAKKIKRAFTISETPPEPRPLVYATV